MITTRRAFISGAALGVALLMAACSSNSNGSDAGDGATSSADFDVADVQTATTMQDLGGMDALIEAAKAEGQLNVIALPPDWANYGELIANFETTYSITVNSAQPDGSSQDEINAVKSLKGTDRAPDVLDVGMVVALANTDLFAPYQNENWGDIADAQKEPTGLWVQDYGGYMAIGYDSTKVPEPATIADLLKPEYKGKVALNGDPTQAGAALNGVLMAAVGSGGSLDDIAPGIEFFTQLKAAGNFTPVQASTATVKNGTTPVVFDWDYLQLGHIQDVPTWKVSLPSDAVIGGYYAQAINADAPHPAAARLWQEYLYSDEGQNLYLKGGARPVRMEAMTQAGTIDTAAADALPAVTGTPQFPTQDHLAKAKELLASDWAKAIG